jgi:hypothetical protein
VEKADGLRYTQFVGKTEHARGDTLLSPRSGRAPVVFEKASVAILASRRKASLILQIR